MTFAQPWMLLALGLLVPIVVAYLVKRRRRVVRVPSTLRWRSLALSRHRNRRFRFLSRLLSLLACLAAVWALVLAASQPMLEGDGQTLAIVIDVSASMGTPDEGPLAEAIEAAEDRIRRRSPRDRIALIAAGGEPVHLAGPTQEPGLLRRGLARLATERGAADIDAAVSLAHALVDGEPGSRVVVLHDGAAKVPAGVHEERFGEGRDNVGVTAFAARPAPDARSDDDREVLVGVAAAGDDVRRVRLTLEAEGVALGEQEVTVAPGEEVDVRFDVRLPARVLRVRAIPADGRPDSVLGDDVAELELGRTTPPPVYVAGASDDTARFFAQRALEASGIDEVETFEGEVAEGGVVVSFGAPQVRPDAPLLVLGGRGEQARWPSGVRSLGPLEGNAAAFRSLEANHPVTRGVDLDGVTIVRATAVDPGEGAPLVELDGTGEGGTVVAAGGTGSGRWVYVGLEPEGSDVVLRVAYPVLVANALAWLGGASQAVVAETPPRTEVALEVADAPLSTLEAPTTWPVPSLPFVLGLIAMLLLLGEGIAYQRRLVR